MLYTAHQEVVEERCELEEAENDSRLRAQKSVVMEMITRMVMMIMIMMKRVMTMITGMMMMMDGG